MPLWLCRSRVLFGCIIPLGQEVGARCHHMCKDGLVVVMVWEILLMHTNPWPTESGVGRQGLGLVVGCLGNAASVRPGAHFGAVVTLLSNVCGWTLGGHYCMVGFADGPTCQNAEVVGAG